jgi:hypothetical protein
MTEKKVYITSFTEDICIPNEYYLDSGFGNRLYDMLYVNILSRIYNFTIIVDRNYFPESEIIHLPNITFLTREEIQSQLSVESNCLVSISHVTSKSTALLESYSPPDSIDGRTPYELLGSSVSESNSIFNIDGQLYDSIVFDYQNSDGYIEYCELKDRLGRWIGIYDNIYSWFSDLRFIKEEVNEFLEQNFSNVTVVHLRRGSGVMPTEEYINTLSQYVSIDLIHKFYNGVAVFDDPYQMPIASDEKIYEIIEKKIEEDPSAIIYLSYDVPSSFVQHFINKYPNNLISKADYIEQYFSFFSEFNLNDPLPRCVSLKRVLVYLFDFFTLCHSRELYPTESYNSSWGHAVNCFRPKENL